MFVLIFIYLDQSLQRPHNNYDPEDHDDANLFLVNSLTALHKYANIIRVCKCICAKAHRCSIEVYYSYISSVRFRVLDDVLRCYEDAFTSGCGNTAGAVIVEVIKRAFNDPYYLRLKYKPDCSLHAGKVDRKPVTRTVYRNSGNSRPSGERTTTRSGARWRGGSSDVSLLILAVMFVQLSMRSPM